MELRAHFQHILDLAPRYSWVYDPPTYEMLQRQQHLEEAADLARGWLAPEEGSGTPNAFGVEAGGRFREMSFARIPWIRVFVPYFSERILAGHFLLWLFSADGHQMYLSLSQSIYEQVDSRWEPIADTERLRRSAAATRSLLEKLDKGRFTQIGLDLGSDILPASAPSRPRVEAYELANIYAIRYPSKALPDDMTFRRDLLNGLKLLIEVHHPEASDRPGTEVVSPDRVSPERDHRATRPRASSSKRELHEPGGHTPAPNVFGHPLPPGPSPMNPPPYP